MTSNSTDDGGYQSARDLPSVIDMERQLSALRAASWLLGKKARSEVKNLREKLDHTISTIDSFHQLLGPRNWIFHDSLNLEDMAALVVAHGDDPKEAERSLIAWYQDPENLGWQVHFLRKHDGLRSRMDLIDFAVADYKAGRHYAVVQLLLSITDGFVNDFDPANRKALHSLDSDGINPWNSVVGMHHGLASVHRTYSKSIKKLNTAPAYELHRHGIVHGMITNYNNDVVSTKAWNFLFAIADWATSRQKKDQEDAKPPPPSWKDLFKQLMTNAENKAELRAFEPAIFDTHDPRTQEHPVHRAATSFLQAWQRPNYGAMAQHVTYRGGPTRAVEVKEHYRGHKLEHFEILHLNHYAAAAAHIRVKLLIDGNWHYPEILFCREDDEGKTVFPQQPGDWRLSTWGLPHMLRDADQGL